MKIREIHIRNFMCFKDVNLKFEDTATILTGENGAGKTAFTKAIQFIMSSNYADFNKAIHFCRSQCVLKNNAFVKIVFLLIEKNKETNKEETLVAVRIFSDIDNIFYNHKNLNKVLPVRNFQTKFKTDNDPFCKISIPDGYFGNKNLLHFIKYYEENYLSKNFKEHIESYHRHLKYDNKEPDEKSSRELLLAERRVLEMLWISKHFDHNRQVNMYVLDAKSNQLPDIENANIIFLLEYYLQNNEMESAISDARILKLENTMHDLIKELNIKNDEYKLLSSTYDFYCSPEKSYNDFVGLFRKVYGIKTTLFKSYVNFLLLQKTTIYTEYMYKLEEYPETEMQEIIREEISHLIDKKIISEKLYKEKANMLRKINKKLNRLNRKEILRKKKQIKTEAKIREASRSLLKELYDLQKRNKIKQIDAELAEIYEDHIRLLEIYLRDYFSAETIIVFKFLIELQQYFDDNATFAICLNNTENNCEMEFFIDLPYKELPKLVFQSLGAIKKAKVQLESAFTEIDPKIPCSSQEFSSIQANITQEDCDILMNNDVLLCFLNEWIVIDYEGLEKHEEPFANEANKENVIKGGYRNSARFEICESYMKLKNHLRSVESECVSDDPFDFDFWSNTMDTKIRPLYPRYESKTENLKGVVQLLRDKFFASEEIHEIFKDLHMLNLKIKILKKFYSGEQLERADSLASQSILAQYDDEKLKWNAMKYNLIIHSRFHLSGDPILSQSQEIYCNRLDSIAFEENVNSFKEMIINFENELITEFNKRYELTSEMLFVWPEINILKHKCSLNAERDSNIRRNLFPLDYDRKNLHFNEYEELIYEKYEKVEKKNFFGIHYKLNEIKEEIKYYEMKSKKSQDSTNKMPNTALNLRQLEMVVNAERALIDGTKVKTVKTFKKLANDINQIFQRLTKHEASVCFMIEDSDDLMSLTDVELDANWFSNVITLVETNNQKFVWTSVEGHIKQLLLIAARIALTAYSRVHIIIIEDLNLLKDFQNVEYLKSSIRQKHSVPMGAAEPVSKNYIQNIVDICNSLELSAFLEYCGIISVKNCYVINCKKTQFFSECVLIREPITLSNDILTLVDESIKKRRSKRLLG